MEVAVHTAMVEGARVAAAIAKRLVGTPKSKITRLRLLAEHKLPFLLAVVRMLHRLKAAESVPLDSIKSFSEEKLIEFGDYVEVPDPILGEDVQVPGADLLEGLLIRFTDDTSSEHMQWLAQTIGYRPASYVELLRLGVRISDYPVRWRNCVLSMVPAGGEQERAIMVGDLARNHRWLVQLTDARIARLERWYFFVQDC